MYIKCTGPFEQGCICVKQYWEKNTSSFHENIWKQQRLKTKEETTYTNTHQPKTSPSKPNLRKKKQNNQKQQHQPTNQKTTKQPTNQKIPLVFSNFQGAVSRTSSTVGIPLVGSSFQASYCFVPWF